MTARKTPEPVMSRQSSLAGLLALICLPSLAAWTDPVRAHDTGSVLGECAALSPRLEDIHGCLDDYLAVMDERLEEIGSLVDRTLDGDARAAFVQSQQAFATYRRQNCLWYLSFSTPRSEAEQIGKDCLAMMSLQRLVELQRLLSESHGDAPKTGYYVYGVERNSFRPCGSEARYWVEGEPTAVGDLQQWYLEIASEDLQVLYASISGELDDTLAAPDGHSGVFRATTVNELRVPREGDCRLLGGVPSLATESTTPAEGEPEPEPVPVAEAPEPVTPVAPPKPEQQLIAYFGAWLVDCTESAGDRVCLLSTGLNGDADGSSIAAATLSNTTPVLALTRRKGGRSGVEVAFPDREIDLPAKIHWSTDDVVFGDIIGSRVRVDERATRQIVNPSAFLDDDLVPAMINGRTLTVEVLEAVDDDRGERFSATLMGLTRALSFADDFVLDNS